MLYFVWRRTATTTFKYNYLFTFKDYKLPKVRDYVCFAQIFLPSYWALNICLMNERNSILLRKKSKAQSDARSAWRRVWRSFLEGLIMLIKEVFCWTALLSPHDFMFSVISKLTWLLDFLQNCSEVTPNACLGIYQDILEEPKTLRINIFNRICFSSITKSIPWPTLFFCCWDIIYELLNSPLWSVQVSIFSIFIRLCNHHHFLIPEYFITPERNPISISSHLPSFLPLRIWQPLIQFCLYGLPILDFS